MITVNIFDPAEQKQKTYKSNGHSYSYRQGGFEWRTTWDSVKKSSDDIAILLDKGMRLVYLNSPQHVEKFIEEKASKWTHKRIDGVSIGKLAPTILREFWQFLVRRCVSVTPADKGGFWLTVESMQGTRKEIIMHFNEMCKLLDIKPTNKVWKIFFSPSPYGGMGITCSERVWASKREAW